MNSEKKYIIEKVKIDSGSYGSSIDQSIAEKLQLAVIGQKKVFDALGEEVRNVVKANVKIKGIVHEIEFTVTNRDGLRNPVTLGRNDIQKWTDYINLNQSID
jgi:hypothetical protein